jgi:hypothetical protein
VAYHCAHELGLPFIILVGVSVGRLICISASVIFID